MIKIILSGLLLLALLGSIFVAHQKRKKLGVKGWKAALTSICMYSIAILNLIAYWTEGLGVISWTATIVLLLSGAYFTKYLPGRPQPS